MSLDKIWRGALTAELGLDFKDQLDTQRETFFFCHLVLYFSLFFFFISNVEGFFSHASLFGSYIHKLLTAVHAL